VGFADQPPHGIGWGRSNSKRDVVAVRQHQHLAGIVRGACRSCRQQQRRFLSPPDRERGSHARRRRKCQGHIRITSSRAARTGGQLLRFGERVADFTVTHRCGRMVRSVNRLFDVNLQASPPHRFIDRNAHDTRHPRSHGRRSKMAYHMLGITRRAGPTTRLRSIFSPQRRPRPGVLWRRWGPFSTP
jgi:hypothetical protein